MKRVIVIGCPGSGKSTFARMLNEATGLPLYYLDRIWHRADKTTISAEAFDAAVREIMNQEQWILDGNYLRTLKMRLERCDTVFFLDLPLETCLSGVESRIGKEREDMPWIETEFDEEFRQWILDFPRDQLPRIYDLLEQDAVGKTVVVFQSREEINRYWEQVKHAKETEAEGHP